MSLKILDDKIKSNDISGVYLFYGDEEFDKERYEEKIKKCFDNLEVGVNLYILDKTNIDMLADLCDLVSFLGSKKLIIVKETGLKFNTSILDNINEDTTIIIEEKSVDKRTSEWKYLSKNHVCIEFSKLNDKEAAQYVIKTLGLYGIRVTPDVADYMIASCTSDKLLLINEFKKITAYLNSGDELTKDVIDYLCVKTLNAKVFDMLDLAVNKKHDKATKKLKELLEQKESAVGISIMLFKQVKQMYMIKLLELDGHISNIAETLGIHPFVYRKLSYAVKNYTIDELRKILLELSEYDEKTKLGEMDMQIGLIQIVTSM